MRRRHGLLRQLFLCSALIVFVAECASTSESASETSSISVSLSLSETVSPSVTAPVSSASGTTSVSVSKSGSFSATPSPLSTAAAEFTAEEPTMNESYIGNVVLIVLLVFGAVAALGVVLCWCHRRRRQTREAAAAKKANGGSYEEHKARSAEERGDDRDTLLVKPVTYMLPPTPSSQLPPLPFSQPTGATRASANTRSTFSTHSMLSSDDLDFGARMVALKNQKDSAVSTASVRKVEAVDVEERAVNFQEDQPSSSSSYTYSSSSSSSSSSTYSSASVKRAYPIYLTRRRRKVRRVKGVFYPNLGIGMEPLRQAPPPPTTTAPAEPVGRITKIVEYTYVPAATSSPAATPPAQSSPRSYAVTRRASTPRVYSPAASPRVYSPASPTSYPTERAATPLRGAVIGYEERVLLPIGPKRGVVTGYERTLGRVDVHTTAKEAYLF